MELIKILLVLFLAGYFTRNWERLRDLREKRLFPGFFQRFGVPRVEHVVPVACATAASLAMFFVLKDLGPALVTFFVFLAMFGAARGKAGAGDRGHGADGGGGVCGVSIGPAAHGGASASTCGSRPGTTTCTAAINWRTRCGPFRRAGHGARGQVGAIRQ